MADEQNAAPEEGQQSTGGAAEPTEQQTVPLSQFNELQERFAKLEEQNKTLFAESKARQERAREAEEAAKQQEIENLKQKEDWQNLYQKTDEQVQSLRQQLDEALKGRAEDQQMYKQKTVEAEALKIASGKSSHEKRCADLAGKIANYSELSEDGSVKYVVGGIELDKQKFSEYIDSTYDYLIDGSRATGGGASGGSGGAATQATDTATLFYGQ